MTSGETALKASQRIKDAIDSAEEIVDPLNSLAEKTKQDPGAPFNIEVLKRLATLKIEDHPRFEVLRAQLKGAGCRVTALDAAIAEQTGHKRREPKHAEVLLELAASAELFRDPNGTAYADVPVEGHRETWPVRSKRFRLWLTREFLNRTRGAPTSEALRSVLNVLEAKALIEGPERPVHIRVGSANGQLYLDLCDTSWKSVEISADGWKVIDNSPVRFCRPTGMKPMPVPMPGGSIEILRPYLNLRSNDDFVLVVGWALAVLRDRGPYPVLVLSGEHGSAKSTFTAVLRHLLDPRTPPFRVFPRDDRDLFVAANNSHLLAFDNISSIPAGISDNLCRLATGGGFAVRQLYTDMDEILFDATRPLILNGITDNVRRPDLADRAITLNLEAIPDDHRRPETEFWHAFNEDKPRILGALLGAAAEGLKRLPVIDLQKLPRMADFALWATACETKWWVPGTFLSAYDENLNKTVENVIEGDPVAATIHAMMVESATQTTWTGTATDLLGTLSRAVDPTITAKYWPKTPRALSNHIRRVEPALRKVGIEIEHFRGKGRGRPRLIEITAKANFSNSNFYTMQPSASSDTPTCENGFNGFACDATPRVKDFAGVGADAGDSQENASVRAKTLTNKDTDGADTTDPKFPVQSGTGKSSCGIWRATS